MQDAADQVTDWFKENHTKLNGTKTKEMVITFAKDPPHIPLININGTEVERVKSTKLLRVIISDNLKWDLHVNSVCSKAGSRMQFLTRLSRSELEPKELVKYYTSIIRSVLEHVCPAWFNNIEDSGHMWELEHIQVRAMKIIFQNLSYKQALNSDGTLHSRREINNIVQLFLKSMQNNSITYYQKPPIEDN